MLVQLILNIKMTKILYHLYYLLDSFHFCETYFTTHPRFVANKSAISPCLGGAQDVSITAHTHMTRPLHQTHTWLIHHFTHAHTHAHTHTRTHAHTTYSSHHTHTWLIHKSKIVTMIRALTVLCLHSYFTYSMCSDHDMASTLTTPSWLFLIVTIFRWRIHRSNIVTIKNHHEGVVRVLAMSWSLHMEYVKYEWRQSTVSAHIIVTIP
jgi:hypothetical protein